MEPPLVSVVAPVYNGETFLRECIDSVHAQTYPHWDFTIIDNASTDRTRAIVEEYAARDPRIRVRSNPATVRVIENHNIAFRAISPESVYCKPLAADDWLFPDCLEKMVRLAEENPTVAIVGAYALRGTGIAWEGLPYPSTVVPGRKICRSRLLGGPYIFGTPSSVLYRSSIVRTRHAFYNESNFHADSEACMEFLMTHDFGFVHQVLTFRRVQDESLTSLSKRLNTYFPGLLYELQTYGPQYLAEDELRTRTREFVGEYYRFLGKALVTGRDKEFWDYHRGKLDAAGYGLSPWRVALGALAFAADILLNPKSSIESLRRRRGPPPQPTI